MKATSVDPTGELSVSVKEMFRRSELEWIITGTLESGSLVEGQPIILSTVEDAVTATVKGLRMPPPPAPDVDFTIMTTRPIERLVPASITSR
jgi:hypothetical protein